MKQVKKFVEVGCIGCGKKWSKRADTLKQWLGRCKSCANSYKARDPILRAKFVKNGKKITARFGGVSNARKFTSEMVSGAKNNFWKGGITPEVRAIRSSQDYKKWRASVFERDSYTCQTCGHIGGQLNADHIKPFSLYPSLRLVLDNGRTLCVPCHKKYGWSLFKENNPIKRQTGLYYERI